MSAEQELRRQVLRRLFSLAPIVATQQVRLEGVTVEELRMIDLALRHVEGEVQSLKNKARQPWRRP